jgi:hypothetical protein
VGRSVADTPVSTRLIQPLLARNTQRNLDRGFPRLKRFLETGTAG